MPWLAVSGETHCFRMEGPANPQRQKMSPRPSAMAQSTASGRQGIQGQAHYTSNKLVLLKKSSLRAAMAAHPGGWVATCGCGCAHGGCDCAHGGCDCGCDCAHGDGMQRMQVSGNCNMAGNNEAGSKVGGPSLTDCGPSRGRGGHVGPRGLKRSIFRFGLKKSSLGRARDGPANPPTKRMNDALLKRTFDQFSPEFGVIRQN